MTERKPLVIGNWKMELSHKGEVALARAFKERLREAAKTIDIVVCPSFPSLIPVREQLGNSGVGVGAQSVHWEEQGAWTGAVSVHQLRGLVDWCIIGHSEQRQLTGMTDEAVAVAAGLLQAQGIAPIVCVGETADERAAEASVTKVTRQVESLLGKITRASLSRLVIAYEPIWAIGTGVTPDSNEVAATMLLIRKLVSERFDQRTAERVRIVYGGSVNPDNIEAFSKEPGVDGALVGGSSIHPNQFSEIVRVVGDLVH